MARRTRRRWTIACIVAACWVVLYGFTGSMAAATVLLVLIAAFGGACVVALRTLGINSGHPWVQQLASRPWRDGQDVLRLALRHLPEVFVITPRGSLLAPNWVELRMSPRDYESLTEIMDVDLINTSAAEVYREEVAAHGAQFASPGPVEVNVVSDPSQPEGRYRLQQTRVQRGPDPALAGVAGGMPLSAPPVSQPGSPGPQSMVWQGAQHHRDPVQSQPGNGPHPVQHVPGDPFPFAHDGRTAAAAARAATMTPPPAAQQAAARPTATPTVRTPPPMTAVTGQPTVAETSRRAVPALRIISGQSVAETWTSGARAGRGDVELVLPDVPTVSREHARFTYADGRWWIANLGLNGLTLNGAPLVGEQPVSDGDSIRWGQSGNTLVSRVEIG
jgi:hypothetical protein